MRNFAAAVCEKLIGFRRSRAAVDVISVEFWGWSEVMPGRCALKNGIRPFSGILRLWTMALEVEWLLKFFWNANQRIFNSSVILEVMLLEFWLSLEFNLAFQCFFFGSFPVEIMLEIKPSLPVSRIIFPVIKGTFQTVKLCFSVHKASKTSNQSKV